MASVIKASGPIRIADGMSFSFDDMNEQANQFLEGVRQEAAKILATAQQEAESIQRRAEHHGQQAAIRAVERVMEEKVGKQVASLIPALKQVVENVRTMQEQWLQEWEHSAIHVACQIAERIARREIAQQPQITLSLIREALEMASGRPEICVRLHPTDHATLSKHVDQLVTEIARLGKVEVIADAQISPGGCRVDTRFGSIDQQLESQLKRIEEELS